MVVEAMRRPEMSSAAWRARGGGGGTALDRIEHVHAMVVVAACCGECSSSLRVEGCTSRLPTMEGAASLPDRGKWGHVPAKPNSRGACERHCINI